MIFSATKHKQLFNYPFTSLSKNNQMYQHLSRKGCLNSICNWRSYMLLGVPVHINVIFLAKDLSAVVTSIKEIATLPLAVLHIGRPCRWRRIILFHGNILGIARWLHLQPLLRRWQLQGLLERTQVVKASWGTNKARAFPRHFLCQLGGFTPRE